MNPLAGYWLVDQGAMPTRSGLVLAPMGFELAGMRPTSFPLT